MLMQSNLVEIYDHILLEKIAKQNKPVIISSGTANLIDIKKQLIFLEKIKKLLYCTG